MTNLSPEAQAVLDAQEDALSSFDNYGRNYFAKGLAAALEAAVQQVQSRQYGECFICSSADILATAAELDTL